MVVTVQVRTDLAPAVRRGERSDTASGELLGTVEELGLVLVQMHPGVPDAVMASFFAVEVDDEGQASLVADRLQRCEAVEAAYLKPPDELPV